MFLLPLGLTVAMGLDVGLPVMTAWKRQLVQNVTARLVWHQTSLFCGVTTATLCFPCSVQATGCLLKIRMWTGAKVLEGLPL